MFIWREVRYQSDTAACPGEDLWSAGEELQSASFDTPPDTAVVTYAHRFLCVLILQYNQSHSIKSSCYQKWKWEAGLGSLGGSRPHGVCNTFFFKCCLENVWFQKNLTQCNQLRNLLSTICTTCILGFHWVILHSACAKWLTRLCKCRWKSSH